MAFDGSRFSSRLTFYDTEKRGKKTFKPIVAGHVSMYTCGPTVYDFAHIGNFRTYVFEDLLRRTLTFFGYEVEQVMNLTDVDDKTIRGAIREGKTLDEYTKQYKDAFFADLKTLGIASVEHYPAATDHIDAMVTFIQDLLDKGYAYKGSDGSVYYSITKFPRYGCLSHLKMEDLQAGASERVASDEYDKDNVSDFVLWKAHDAKRDGDIFWDSPFGPGRPGWHIECSAMAMGILGKQIDIHCGGVDNIFPHHENEIAQTEACTGERFVNYWLHSEHLIVEGKKMSKSLGNFYTLRSLLDEGFTGQQVRYLLMQTHYKTQLNFSHEGLAAAKSSLGRLHDFYKRLQRVEGDETGAADKLLEESFTRFGEALADDLNISAALAALFDMIREGNSLCDQEKLGRADAKKMLALLDIVDSVLNIMEVEEEEVPSEITELVAQREQARTDRDWGLADRLRDTIIAKGYVLEDTAGGTRVKKA